MPTDWTIDRNSSGQPYKRSPDRAIAELAGRSHEVVERGELLALGLSPDDVAYRLRIGRLHPVHPRVYTVGSPSLSALGRLLAGQRWVGPGAVLSHRSAAYVLGIARLSSPVHVTAQRRLGLRPGVVVHSRDLPADERDEVDGVPVTSLARTLLDLAATEGADAMERALREATFRGITDPLGLPRLIERHRGQPGTRVASRVLEERRWVLRTRSELEARFLEFLDEAGLPRPRTNFPLRVAGRGIEADCAWPEHRLIVELDGRDAHRAPERFEDDRSRDAALTALGWRVIRVTWRRLHRERKELEGQLRALLAAGDGEHAVAP